MSEICKNWTQWLKENRFAGQTPEMIEQTTRWLEAVRDVILVYAEIMPHETFIDIGCGTGLLAFKVLEMQNCKGKVIFSISIVLIYLMSGIDFIPEMILGIFGLFDDLFVVVWCLGIINEEIEKFKKIIKEDKNSNIIEDVQFHIYDEK
jgi:uncharacterized membrane protein YkvA (DUF1232 family)